MYDFFLFLQLNSMCLVAILDSHCLQYFLPSNSAVKFPSLNNIIWAAIILFYPFEQCRVFEVILKAGTGVTPSNLSLPSSSATWKLWEEESNLESKYTISDLLSNWLSYCVASFNWKYIIYWYMEATIDTRLAYIYKPNQNSEIYNDIKGNNLQKRRIK